MSSHADSGGYLEVTVVAINDAKDTFSRVITQSFKLVSGTLSLVGSENVYESISEISPSPTLVLGTSTDKLTFTLTNTEGSPCDWSITVDGNAVYI